ncbi:unnamed protein product [Rhizophagus irregularis]|nr:unnamed protein product [Rhizophagus irregularis]
MSLHKSRRSRNNYKKKGKLDNDDRRLHANGRMNDKKIRRLKAAKALYDKDDVRIAHYEKQEMINIIQDIRYHSPELSETDEENASEKRQIVVYNRSWRSSELKTFFREVLDPYSFTQQNAQLTRRRNYDDTLQNFDIQPPNDAPQWTCVEPGNGNVVYDSDIGYESIYDSVLK